MYFNGQSVEISMDDILQLEKDMKTENLPKNEGGFMFGVSYGKDDGNWKQNWVKNDDQEFIEKAKEALNQDYYLYYTSSW